MKKELVLTAIGLFILCLSSVFAQDHDSTSSSSWDHNVEVDLNFMKENFIFLPIYSADKSHLHLEARYNYEDLNTFSAWMGYNFSGGKNTEYKITPMVGGIIGRTNGIAPGLEILIGLDRFEFSSESEYVFDLQEKENDFFYNWTDLTYSPLDWLWLGLSTQLTLLYQDNFEYQPGFLVGGGFKRYEMSGYLFSPGFDELYFVLILSANF
ncbi:MAG: hypothetical protein PHD61_10575 [Bacteroidales bacterium]|nr:hypothetical protein [Lentimicrobiaceae bacterium]MDD5695731.1 hypothetical protein [Bacteroidales bacterium]